MSEAMEKWRSEFMTDPTMWTPDTFEGSASMRCHFSLNEARLLSAAMDLLDIALMADRSVCLAQTCARGSETHMRIRDAIARALPLRVAVGEFYNANELPAKEQG